MQGIWWVGPMPDKKIKLLFRHSIMGLGCLSRTFDLIRCPIIKLPAGREKIGAIKARTALLDGGRFLSVPHMFHKFAPQKLV